jgi:hypothetical protein
MTQQILKGETNMPTLSIEKGLIFTSLISSLFFISCSSVTLQSPKVAEPGKSIVGASSAIVISEKPMPIEIGAYGRFGIVENIDAGLKLSYPGPVVLADVKYQITEEPLLVSADLGFSYMFNNPQDFNRALVFYPTLLFGTEHLYGGAKLIYIVGKSQKTALPGILIGGSIGDEFRITPELNVYLSQSSNLLDKKAFPIPVFGFGFQYHF